MAAHRYVYVNAFAEDLFGGNPCMVFFGADDLDEETRLKITRESRLSECAFLQKPASDADFAVRYYLASGPIPMAGHPTVATGIALIEAGLVRPGDSFRLEVGAGVMPIETRAGEGGRPPIVTMTQFAPKFGESFDPGEIAAIYGLSAEDFLAPPQVVGTGNMHVLAPLRNREALRRAKLNPEAVARFHAAHPELTFAEAFLFVPEGETPEGRSFARLLLAPPNPPEDPFTGSATGAMASWLWREGYLDSPRFVAEQGHWMGRPGRAEVEILGPREAISGVKVGGPGVALMRGEIAV